MEQFSNGPMACEDCDNFDAVLAIEAEAKRLTEALLAQVQHLKQEQTA